MTESRFLERFNQILDIELDTQNELAHARKAAAKNVRHLAEASHRVSKDDHPAIRLLIQFLNRKSPVLHHAMNVHMPKQIQLTEKSLSRHNAKSTLQHT